MADPLSVAASIIGVAAIAYSSCRSLYQIISEIHDAPETFLHLKTDLETLSEIMHSIQRNLEDKTTDAVLSEAQKSNLREIKPILEACRGDCEKFKAKIATLMRHSKDGRVGLRDKIKLQFQEKDVVAFQAKLGSYKLTLAVSLDFSTFKAASENLDATRGLETRLEEVTAHLTGQLEGLKMGLQAIRDADAVYCALTETQQSAILHAIEQQGIALNHCHRACMAAFQDTAKATGHEYKYVKASNQARLLMGDLGNATVGTLHKYSNIEVEGGFVVAGNMEGNLVRDFFR